MQPRGVKKFKHFKFKKIRGYKRNDMFWTNKRYWLVYMFIKAIKMLNKHVLCGQMSP